MTRNPNTRVEDMHLEPGPIAEKRALTIGSLLTTAFMLVVAFVVSHFYD